MVYTQNEPSTSCPHKPSCAHIFSLYTTLCTLSSQLFPAVPIYTQSGHQCPHIKSITQAQNLGLLRTGCVSCSAICVRGVCAGLFKVSKIKLPYRPKLLLAQELAVLLMPHTCACCELLTAEQVESIYSTSFELHKY